jgi:hypothetical protein
MIKLKNILLEFVDQNITRLQKYLDSNREEKIEEIFYMIGLDKFVPWFIETDVNKTGDVGILYDYTEEEDDILEDAEDDFLTGFKSRHPEFYEEMHDYVNKKFEDRELDSLFQRFGIDYAEYPSWYYLDAVDIVKNQWLVHGTDESNLNSLKSSGFIKGVDDYTKLGLTTWFKGDSGIKSYPGYNFAYTVADFEKYGYTQQHGLTYGDAVVVFRASGLRCYHVGDREFQVIFNGRTATDIVPVFQEIGDGDWYILGKDKEGQQFPKMLYRNENLVEVTKWLDVNYAQYRKAIGWEKPKK